MVGVHILSLTPTTKVDISLLLGSHNEEEKRAKTTKTTSTPISTTNAAAAAAAAPSVAGATSPPPAAALTEAITTPVTTSPHATPLIPGRRPYPSADVPAKKQSKWSSEEDALIIELRGGGMKWEDISKRLPGRSAISCRLHYQNYLERRSEWDEDRKNKLARLYERYV